MPRYKNPRRDAREEQDAGERPHSHKHTHEAGAQPHEHTYDTITASGQPGDDLPHLQSVSGAGPDAGSPTNTDPFTDGLTAPHGSGGFSLSQHERCLTPEQKLQYLAGEIDVLPETCRRGHAPR